MKKVYIATPSDVFEDEIVSTEEMGDCLIMNCKQTIVVTSKEGDVFMKTSFPNEVKAGETDEGSDPEVYIGMVNIVQRGTTNFIKAFSNKQEAEVFRKNAETVIKLQQACEMMNKENEEEDE